MAQIKMRSGVEHRCAEMTKHAAERAHTFTGERIVEADLRGMRHQLGDLGLVCGHG